MVSYTEVIQKRAWRKSNGDLLEADFWLVPLRVQLGVTAELAVNDN